MPEFPAAVVSEKLPLGMEVNDAAAPAWARPRPARMSDHVVRQFKADLLAGDLRSGQALGSEGQLAQRFGISRLTMRDAVRALEAIGIVQVKAGLKGGVRVASSDLGRFALTLAAQLKLLGLNRMDAIAAEVGLEWVAAELAAVRATEDDLREMAACLEAGQRAVPNGPSYVRTSYEFHRLLAAASHNSAIVTSLAAVREIVATTRTERVGTDWMQHTLAVHQSVLDALRRRDPSAAGELASDHARIFLRLAMASTDQNSASEPESDPDATVDGLQPVSMLRGSDEIVRQVKRELFRNRLRPGDSLGSVEDLSAKFGVSQATVRDALRSLEASNLVEVRTGSGGGARIANGDPSRLADSLAVQFRLANLSTREAIEAIVGLEWISAELTAARATMGDRNALRLLAARSQRPEPQFHRALISLSHNWAIMTVVSALEQLLSPGTTTCTAAGIAATTHQVIAEAVLSGRPEGAGRVMREHTLPALALS